ncbi:MAG: adenine phosphoribosyltransferase, partial [Lachnospiraceae bacterium]|nr:adenine phosphoribosyltransferase [Lachnospiraceae bacterium]
IKPGQKVVIIDDLLATGGTGEAIIQLVEKMGGQVTAVAYAIELAGLKGREKMHGVPVEALVSYEGK